MAPFLDPSLTPLPHVLITGATAALFSWLVFTAGLLHYYVVKDKVVVKERWRNICIHNEDTCIAVKVQQECYSSNFSLTFNSGYRRPILMPRYNDQWPRGKAINPAVTSHLQFESPGAQTCIPNETKRT